MRSASPAPSSRGPSRRASEAEQTPSGPPADWEVLENKLDKWIKRTYLKLKELKKWREEELPSFVHHRALAALASLSMEAKYSSSAAQVLGEPSYDVGGPTPGGAMAARGREAQRARARRGSFDERRADPLEVPATAGEPLAMACAGRDLERMHCHKFAEG